MATVRGFFQAAYGRKFLFISWLIASAFVVALPIVILWEFRGWGSDSLLLLKLYPHLVLVPPMLYVVMLWLFATMIRDVWRGNEPGLRSKLVKAITFVGFITILATAREVTGTPIMFLELAPQTVWNGSPVAGQQPAPRSAQSLCHEYADLLLLIRASPADPTLSARRTDMQKALAYETWKGRGQFSDARFFYLVTFFICMFTAINVFFGLTYVPRINKEARASHITKLFMMTAGLSLWIPVRVYFNLHVKSPVTGLHGAAHSGADIALYFTLIACVIGLVIKNWVPESKIKNVLAIVGIVIPGGYAFFGSPFLDSAIGLTSTPGDWTMILCSVGAVFYVYSHIAKTD
jgi:hypothetical protein